MTTCNPPTNPPLGDEKLCSGYGLSGDALFQYWCENDCQTTYSKLLFDVGSGGVLAYVPTNLPQVQNDFTNLFNTFLTTNDFTDNTSDRTYSPFQTTLVSACQNDAIPGGCAGFLNTYCQSYTRTQVSLSPILAELCGCFVPEDPSYAQYNVSQVCDPLCHRIDAIQLYDPTTGDKEECKDTVCVIDQVNINISKASVGGGGINFYQACVGCTQATPCECIVSNTNVSQTLQEVGINVSFNQYCGPDSVCVQLDAQGNATTIPCPTGGTGSNPTATASSAIPAIIIIVVILLAVFLVFIFLAIKGDHPKTTNVSIEETGVTPSIPNISPSSLDQLQAMIPPNPISQP